MGQGDVGADLGACTGQSSISRIDASGAGVPLPWPEEIRLMTTENSCSRRELVKFVGAGFAGAALTSSIAFAEAQQDGSSTSAAVVDPTSKYPKPPYPGQ